MIGFCSNLFDVNAEIEFWTMTGNIKVNLYENMDIRKFYNY